MSPIKAKLTQSHKKRTGQHHRPSKHYHKVYWPYVTMLCLAIIGLFASSLQPQATSSVLAYATEMNIATLLTSTNQHRANNGQQALQINTKLSKAAQDKANDMTARNYWSHNTPDGDEPWVFVTGVGYDYQRAGENLAYGFNSSSATVAGWMNSPSHRENMLASGYTEVGFGFANSKDFNKSGPETVVVAMYGLPADVVLPVKENTASANAASQNDGTLPVTSANPITKEPDSQTISRLQTFTAGQLPWLGFAIGLTAGGLMVFLLVKHGLAIRRIAAEGEEFIIHHPILDVFVISLVLIGYLLLQGSGIIR